MDDKLYHWWDILLKAFGLLGLAMGGAFSGYQYFQGLAEQRKAAVRESRKPFLAQRQELYGETMRTVSELAYSTDNASLAAAQLAFWRLYWGPLASVESPKLEAIMVAIGRCLADDDNGKKLRELSLDLAHSIRAESQDTWGVDLPELLR